MAPDVVRVTPLDGFLLLLDYVGGERRTFDMTPLLDETPWTVLRDPVLFRRATVEYGTVVWPGGIDVAPETLYADSRPEGMKEAS